LQCDRELPAGTRYRHRRICKSSLLKWKHWPSTQGGTHATTRKSDAICFRNAFDLLFFAKRKSFRKKSESVSETKNIFL